MELLITCFIFIIGIIFGSFYNVVGYRLPKEESIVFPSSHCPKCNKKLKFYENIPIISYIFLGGKCSGCKKKISIIYPLFELFTGILFVISYKIFGFSFEFISSLIISSVMICITISDIREYIIPDEVLIIGSILVIITNIIKTIVLNTSILTTIIYPVLHGLASFAFLYLLKIIGDFIFKQESLGGGDIKLLFFIGLCIGFDMSIVSIFLAAFIALPLSIFNLLKKDSNILPFGPYLAISCLIILFGNINLNMIYNFFVN